MLVLFGYVGVGYACGWLGLGLVDALVVFARLWCIDSV